MSSHRLHRIPFHHMLLAVLLTVLPVFSTTGCNFAEKADTLKDDIINITLEQVAMQLENSLNQELGAIQVNTPQVINSKGEVDWELLKQTELGNYVFYSMGSYEFRAVLTGDGIFRIERTNFATGETFAYAEFNATIADGKFDVSVK